jgi:hypothetical protein
MKVLIQNVRTGLYLGRRETWTAWVSHARNFCSSCEAYAVMKAERMSGLRVVFYFEDMDYTISAREQQSESHCEQLQPQVVGC